MWKTFSVMRPRAIRHPDYQQACEWFEQHTEEFNEVPKPEDEIVLAYARERYASILEVLKELESKSESLFKLGTVLLVAAAAAAEFNGTLGEAGALAATGRCGLLLMLAGIFYSLVAKLPVYTIDPVNIADAIDSVGSYECGVLRVRLAARMHLAYVGTKISTEWKADKITTGSWLIAAGSVMVGCSLIV